MVGNSNSNMAEVGFPSEDRLGQVFRREHCGRWAWETFLSSLMIDSSRWSALPKDLTVENLEYLERRTRYQIPCEEKKTDHVTGVHFTRDRVN